jgi:hypothetical protein
MGAGRLWLSPRSAGGAACLAAAARAGVRASFSVMAAGICTAGFERGLRLGMWSKLRG